MAATQVSWRGAREAARRARVSFLFIADGGLPVHVENAKGALYGPNGQPSCFHDQPNFQASFALPKLRLDASPPPFFSCPVRRVLLTACCKCASNTKFLATAPFFSHCAKIRCSLERFVKRAKAKTFSFRILCGQQTLANLRTRYKQNLLLFSQLDLCKFAPALCKTLEKVGDHNRERRDSRDERKFLFAF